MSLTFQKLQVTYLPHSSGSWIEAEAIGWAGKSTVYNHACFNIHKSEFTINAINFESQREQWKYINKNASGNSKTSAQESVNITLMFHVKVNIMFIQLNLLN